MTLKQLGQQYLSQAEILEFIIKKRLIQLSLVEGKEYSSLKKQISDLRAMKYDLIRTGNYLFFYYTAGGEGDGRKYTSVRYS